MTLPGAALWYVNRGCLVFPLRPGLKTPLHGGGHNKAGMDPDTIRAWWHAEPRANIGLVCGHLFDVYDFDGDQGAESSKELEADRPIPNPIGYAKTPNGHHIYVPATGERRKIGIMPGIDYLGRNGYVIAPPSIVGGNTYRWITPPNLGDPQ